MRWILEHPVLIHPLLHALEIATDMHVHCWQTLSHIRSEGMGNSYTIHISGINRDDVWNLNECSARFRL